LIAVRPLTYRTVPQFDGLNPLQVVAWDYDATSHSVRGHPLEPLREQLSAAGLPDAQTVAGMKDGETMRYAGLVTYVGCGSVDRVAVGPGWPLTRMYR